MKKEETALIETIKSVFCRKAPMFLKSDINWEQVYSLAQAHNVLPFLCQVVLNRGLVDFPDALRKRIEKDYTLLIAKSLSQTYSANEIMDSFEEHKIDILPLKGICTKERYPGEFLRTMGDLDFLYAGAQTKQVKCIMQELEFQDFREGRMHDSYQFPPYVSVEMHRTLVPGDAPYSEYYDCIWEKCTLKQGNEYIYEMPLEDELVFNVVHFVEHFKDGGAGIRFVCDVYVYSQIDGLKWDYIDKELGRLGLQSFYSNMLHLADYWFNSSKRAECDEQFIQEIEAYIMSGGTFGTMENAAAVATAQGKVRFLIKNCFPSIREMQSMFPWLIGYPVLLPVAWWMRAWRALIKRKSSITKQFTLMQTSDSERGNYLKDFYSRCGL